MSRIRAWIQSIRNDRLVQFIVGATMFAVVSVIVLIVVNPAMDQPSLGTELSKAAVQVTVVALGGAVVAAIVKSAELNREAREQRIRDEELQRRLDLEYLMSNVLQEVTDTYNRVKSVRRKLNAAGIQPPNLDEAQEALVKEQMAIMDDAQLDLERMMRAIRVRHFAFRAADGTSISEGMTNSLRQMEGYVNHVRSETSSDPEKKSLAQFLGHPNQDGGLRKGGKVYPPKRLATEDPERMTWNGPAAVLRQMEEMVAGMVPDHTDRPRKDSRSDLSR